MYNVEIYLLRHAESTANRLKILDSNTNTGLSKQGLKEAQELKKKLKQYRFDTIIISPLKRAWQTIKPYSKTIKNVKIIKSALTLEREGGEFTGQKQFSIIEYCKRKKINKVLFRPKHGESILDVYERAKKFKTFLLKKYGTNSILIVGHRNFLTCLEIALRKKNIKRYYRFKGIKNGELRRITL